VDGEDVVLWELDMDEDNCLEDALDSDEVDEIETLEAEECEVDELASGEKVDEDQDDAVESAG